LLARVCSLKANEEEEEEEEEDPARSSFWLWTDVPVLEEADEGEDEESFSSLLSAVLSCLGLSASAGPPLPGTESVSNTTAGSTRFTLRYF